MGVRPVAKSWNVGRHHVLSLGVDALVKIEGSIDDASRAPAETTVLLTHSRIGEILIRAGILDKDQLRTALGEQDRFGDRLGFALIKLGMVDEGDLVQALASQLDLPIVTLEGKRIPEEVLSLVPSGLAAKHLCLPLFIKEVGGIEMLFLGMDDPVNLEILDDLSFHTGMQIKPVMVAPTELRQGIDRFYLAGMPSRPAPSTPAPAEIPTAVTLDEDTVTEITSVDSAVSDASESNEKSRTGIGRVEVITTPLVVCALVEMLIDKGVFSREELDRTIRSLQSAEDEGC